jgi:hypothetical protein
MMCSGRELLPEDVRWIQRLFSYGFSWRRIRWETGFSIWAIKRYQPRQHQRQFEAVRAERAEQAAKIRELRSQGLTIRQIGDRLALNKKRVKNLLDADKRREKRRRRWLSKQSAPLIRKRA